MFPEVNLWIYGAGVFLLLLTCVDALWTVIMPHGGGPLTTLVGRGLWKGLQMSPNVISEKLKPVAGSLSLLGVMGLWIILLWLGWWLLFTADPGSVLSAQDRLPAGDWDRVYFTGFLIFTLGVGDYVPHGPGWQVATALASFSGLFLITLAITYILSVLSAVTDKRTLAAMIRDMGASPEDILTSGWDGESFDELMDRLNSAIWPMIHEHTERHKAYPILHYFHSTKRQGALSVNLASLDEALTLLACGVAEQDRPRPWQLTPVRRAIAGLLALLDGEFIKVTEDLPPAPKLDRLSAAGIPTRTQDEFAKALGDLKERRSRLISYVHDSGWTWDPVQYSENDTD